MMPSCSHTGTPRIPFDGFRHLTSSTTSGSACLMMRQTRASVSPRQSPSSLILASISRAAESPFPPAFGPLLLVTIASAPPDKPPAYIKNWPKDNAENFRRGCHIGGFWLVMMSDHRRNRTMNVNDLFAAAPELLKKWTATSQAIASGLDPTLVRLVEIRASQINGCANCINMHTQEARAQGETEQRIYLLSAWRQAPCYTDRERAALGWTEALTRLSEGVSHESAYEALQTQFSKEEQVKLTLMINVINGWNRISVGFDMFIDPADAKSATRAAAA